MRLSQVLLRISWQRPNDPMMTASSFMARTTDGYVLPRFHAGLEVVGNDQHNTAMTRFILPDGQLSQTFAGNISVLFDRVKDSGTVDVVSNDEIHAWVYADGEVVMRGKGAIEQFAIVRAGDVLYSDNPDNVLILQQLQFLSAQQIAELESHMGQP